MSPRAKHDKFCVICGKLLPSSARKVCPPSLAEGYKFGSKCAKKHSSNQIGKFMKNKYATNSEFRKKKKESIRRWRKNNPEKVRAQKRRNYQRRKERERRERDD